MSEIISSAVVPVVIISACALLVLAFQNRLSGIVSRLRALQRERLSEYRAVMHQKGAEQYLHVLEAQTAEILKRAGYLRTCLCCLMGSIFAFALCSLAIGLSMTIGLLELFVVILFVLGMLLLLYGLFFAFRELRISLSPIEMESAFIQKLLSSEMPKERSE